MDKKRAKLLIAITIALGIIFGSLLSYRNTGELDKKEIKKAVNLVEDAIIDYYDNDIPDYQPTIVTNETQNIVDETIESTLDGEDVSTTEIIKSSEEEELEVTDEGALEEDAVIEQENISYDGTNTGNGLSLLGAYQGLTYFSQADERWASIMYSSIGDSSQTMRSSACGPTSAAMIVSSSKGAILPTTMANLSVDNGYRTAGNGTAWSYFPFIADYFDGRTLEDLDKTGINMEAFNHHCLNISLINVYFSYYGKPLEKSAQFGISPMFRDIFEFMEKRIKLDKENNSNKITPSAPKYVIVSGHDVSLAAFDLYLENKFNIKYTRADYANNQIFELWKKEDKYYINYLINLELGGEFEYDYFKKKVSEDLYSDEDIRAICNNTKKIAL